MSTIDSRMQQISRLQITYNNELQAGALSSDQATSFQADIDRLTQEAQAVDSGGMSLSDYRNDVMGVRAELSQQLGNISSQTQYTNQLSVEINRGASNGTLTSDEAAGLQAELASFDSTTSPQQLSDFRQLVKDTTTNLNVDGPTAQNNLNARLAAGVNDGSLTAEQAQELGNAINAVDWQNGDPATVQQAWAQFNTQIYQERHNGAGDFDARSAFVQQEISALPSSQQAAYQSQLDAITASGANGNHIGQLNALAQSITAQNIRNQMQITA